MRELDMSRQELKYNRKRFNEIKLELESYRNSKIKKYT